MVIDELIIHNFKGIDDLHIKPNGNDVDIYGRNGTGKTTVGDAILWLLTDKDSLGQAQFDIKPMGTSGSGIVTSVEIICQIGKKKVELKKEYSEKWTTPRGKATAVFSGHTTEYFINEVPTMQKDWGRFIEKIADGDIFKLLTNPLYFNDDKLFPWKKRRDLILEICGDVSDEDVYSSDDSLSDLQNEADGRRVDDFKAVLASKRTKINDKKKAIPHKIEEAEQYIQKSVDEDGKPITVKFVKAIIGETKTQIESLSNDLNHLLDGGGLSKLKAKRSELDSKIVAMESDLDAQAEKRRIDARKIASTSSTVFDHAERKLNKAKKDLEFLTGQEIPAQELKIKSMREEFSRIEDFVFIEPTVEKNCSQCGSPLDPEKIDQIIENARKQHNHSRAKKMAEINASGKKEVERLNEMKERKQKLREDIDSLQLKFDEAEVELKRANKKLNSIQVEKSKDLEALMAERDKVADKIEGWDGDIDQGQIDVIKSEIESLEKQLDALRNSEAALNESEKAKSRIEKHKEDERLYSSEIENIDRLIFLTEEFTRRKVEMLQSKISSKFKIARFKMFHEQINEGLRDMCQLEVDGVPFRSLNKAMRINAGLDICNTVSQYYGVTLPIIIDNAEAVTDIFDTEAQQIRLYVEKKAKQLNPVISGE